MFTALFFINGLPSHEIKVKFLNIFENVVIKNISNLEKKKYLYGPDKSRTL